MTTDGAPSMEPITRTVTRIHLRTLCPHVGCEWFAKHRGGYSETLARHLYDEHERVEHGSA